MLVSGHTHGGQIWPANVLFNIAKFDDAVYGETVGADGKFKAFVTSGIAGWGYPVKTAAPAEYVIINISKNKQYFWLELYTERARRKNGKKS